MFGERAARTQPAHAPPQSKSQIEHRRSSLKLGSPGESTRDLLFFGVAGDKNVHHVLCFDLDQNALTARDADKGVVKTLSFANVLRVRSEQSGTRVAVRAACPF